MKEHAAVKQNHLRGEFPDQSVVYIVGTASGEPMTNRSASGHSP